MSNVGQGVSAVVGAVIGFIATGGSPAGAYYGFNIGLLAGTVLFPTQLPKQFGPRINDINTTTAQLGVPVPITYGTFAVPGTVIALGCLVETEDVDRVGGKGAPEQKVVNYFYNQTIAVGLCEGIICDVRRIWENGLVMFDMREQQPDETNDAYAARLEMSAVYSENMTIYYGDETQEPDPDLETAYGEGMVPAFRGLAYIVFPERLLLESQALRHPQWRFEVIRGTGERGYTEPTLLDGPLTAFDLSSLYADWTHNRFFTRDDVGPEGEQGIRAFTLRNNTEYLQRTYVDMFGFEPIAVYEGTVGTDGFLYLAIAVDNDAGYFVRIDPETLEVVAQVGMGLFSSQWRSVTSVRVSGFGHTFDLVIGGALLQNTIKVLRGDTLGGIGSWTDDRAFNKVVAGHSDEDYSYAYGLSFDGVIGGDNETIDILKFTCGVVQFINPIAGTVDYIPEVAIEKVGSVNVSDIRSDWLQVGDITGIVFDRTDNTIMFSMNGSTIGGVTLDGFTDRMVKINPETLEVVLSIDIEAYPGLMMNFDDNNNLSRVSRGRYAQISPLGTNNMYSLDTVTGEVTVENWTGSLPGNQSQSGEEIYDAVSDCLLTYITNVGPVLICLSTCGDEGVILGDIVEDVCLRSGVPDDGYDVSELTQIVYGYGIMRNMSGRDAIEPLRPIAPFDSVESDMQIKFPVRGRASSKTYELNELSAHESGSEAGPAVTVDKTQAFELPRQIRVHYIAPSRDYEPGEKLSPPRFSPEIENELDIEISVAMEDTMALQIADVIMADVWAGRWKHTIQVDVSSLALEPTDIVLLPIDGRLYRCRIAEVTDVSGGLLRKMELVRDDDGAYVSTAVADTPQVPVITGPVIISETELLILDLPPLRDEDDNPGVYAVVYRTESYTWGGAVIARSADEGATWGQLSSSLVEGTTGTLVEALGVGDHTMWDTGNTLLVNITSGQFESRLESDIFNGANTLAVGSHGRWEIVQFTHADVEGAGVVRLSGLLRGRRGTEVHIGSSQAGDRVVLLSDGALIRLPLQQTEINQERSYRSTTIGLAAGQSGIQEFTGAGQALEAWAPCNIAGERNGSDDLTITFSRRARFGSDLTAAYQNLPNDTEPEDYEIDIIGDSDADVVRTIDTSVESAVYTAAQQTTDFGSPQASVTVKVYQISTIVGRGLAGEATI